MCYVFAAQENTVPTSGQTERQDPQRVSQCVYIRVHTCVRMYGWMDVHMYVCMDVGTYVCMYVCMDGWMDGCTYTCVCVLVTYILSRCAAAEIQC